MLQNNPNYDSNPHFGPFWLPRGGLEGSKSNIARAGPFFARKYMVF